MRRGRETATLSILPVTTILPSLALAVEARYGLLPTAPGRGLLRLGSLGRGVPLALVGQAVTTPRRGLADACRADPATGDHVPVTDRWPL